MRNRSEYRAAYQKLYYDCKHSFWTDPVAKERDMTWQQYLDMKRTELKVKFASKEVNQRGPYKDHSTFTDRQLYQATYQRARRVAEAAFRGDKAIAAQYSYVFADYWADNKHVYLPDFFKNKPRQVRTTPQAYRPHKPKAAAVRMETDPEPDNQPWLAAA